jgi:hypothetical protein
VKAELRFEPVSGKTLIKIERGCRRVNMVPVLCTQYENGKISLVEMIPQMGGGEIKENDRGGKFNYDIL